MGSKTDDGRVNWWLVGGVHLLPALAILFFGWGAFDVVALYWVESGVMGIVTLLRMAWARHLLAGEEAERPTVARRLFLSGFFCVHYGLFMLVHAVFIVQFLGPPTPPGGLLFSSVKQLLTPALLALGGVFLAQHLWEFRRDYLGEEEWKTAGVKTEMHRPYRRIAVMHLAILFGGFLVILLGARFLALLLIGLRLAFEHLRKTGINLFPTGPE